MSKGGSQTTHYNNTTKTDMNAYEKAHQENFTSPQMKKAYQGLQNRAFDNYDQAGDLSKSLYNNYMSGKSLGDDSYFKQGWNDWNALDTNPYKKIYMTDIDPMKDQGWVKAMNDISANDWRKYGKVQNQINQNIIASGMANGSGHQTAAYNAAANYASQDAANRGNLYMQQRQNNAQNIMNAGNSLNNIYQGITNTGLGAWQTSQQGFDKMLNGMNLQNSALGTLGKAIELGSDPTMTSEGRQWGTSNSKGEQTTENKPGWGQSLGLGLGMIARMPIFGG